ncbi:MAG: ATP-dependent zinc protease [Alphaproteobacteria bacterium]
MKFISKFFFVCVAAVLLPSCKTQVTPAIVPAVEVKKPSGYPLGIIGAVEPAYILPMKSQFFSRIDTGAENSSIDVDNKKTFERDGEKWVSFDITNRETGEKHHFEKPVIRQATIKRIHKAEKRTIVSMDLKIGDKIITENFSLAHRDKFEYQVLIGRNILTGRALVDTSLSNTLN